MIRVNLQVFNLVCNDRLVITGKEVYPDITLATHREARTRGG